MSSWRGVLPARALSLSGRGINYPIALEGALKLKEISYIHAEGYPAGEMKHGPIALIDKTMPVVTIATQDHVYDKMISQIEQVKARGGIVIGLVQEEIRLPAARLITFWKSQRRRRFLPQCSM